MEGGRIDRVDRVDLIDVWGGERQKYEGIRLRPTSCNYAGTGKGEFWLMG